MTHEEQMTKAVHALNLIHNVLSDHGEALTKTEVNNLLHGIAKTLVEITKKADDTATTQKAKEIGELTACAYSEPVIKESIAKDKAKGTDPEEIERSWTAAYRCKLITLNEWAYAMDQIWG